MPLFKKKKIKSKTPDDYITKKIPKDKIEKTKIKKIKISEFNPPPKKESINEVTNQKFPGFSGKINKKSINLKSSPIDKSHINQNLESVILPTHSGYNKDKNEKKDLTVPKYALENKSQNKQTIPKHTGGFKQSKEYINQSLRIESSQECKAFRQPRTRARAG